MKTLALSANGEGFGHVSRMVSLTARLLGRYKLVLYAPKSVHQFLIDKIPQIASGELTLHCIPGLAFAKKDDRIDYLGCVKLNLPVVLRLRTHVARVRAMLQEDGVDALLSDFEPFAAWAAWSLGLPVLQMNHPGIVSRSASIMPDALFAKWVASMMMGPWHKRILVSFFDGDVGPMIRPEITSAAVSDNGRLLVYLKPGYRKGVLHALRKNGITEYDLFPDAKRNYVEALASCRAVIAGGGHQTICEALHLDKPILCIPQRGQYEQRLNARLAEIGGFGRSASMGRLARDLGLFIKDLNEKRLPRAPLFPWIHFEKHDCTEKVIRRIASFLKAASGPRIIPFRGLLVDSWLGEHLSVSHLGSEQSDAIREG